jgi:LCP family protein required for cell wall assembly
MQIISAANDTYDNLDRDKSDLREEKVTIKDNPVSILLMGVEDYSTEGQTYGRVDTLLVATFNPSTKDAYLLSIPRDTYVNIPGREKKDKINHSHAFGGKELTIKTVENYLDIPIDYYAMVNFDSFKEVVDTLGGITVDVPFDFKQNSDDPKAEKLEFYEGEMTLDGRYALAYARMRLEDPRGDIGRNERQREVIQAILDELTSFSTLGKIGSLAKDVSENVETNISINEGLSFIANYKDFNNKKLKQLTLDGESETIDSISYYIPSDDAYTDVVKKLQEHLELE